MNTNCSPQTKNAIAITTKPECPSADCTTVPIDCPISSDFSISIPSARPAKIAAGSITATRPRKPISAVCQPAVEISVCASGEAITSPSDPAADTAPIATLRLAAETVRDVTVMVMLEAVHDKASPMQRPQPRVKTSAEVETIMITSPAAYTRTPVIIT